MSLHPDICFGLPYFIHPHVWKTACPLSSHVNGCTASLKAEHVLEAAKAQYKMPGPQNMNQQNCNSTLEVTDF